MAACTAKSLLSVVTVELRCLSWLAEAVGIAVGSSASFSAVGMRRRSTVALTSSSYLRSRLAALLAAEVAAEADDCGAGSSLTSGLGGRIFKVGR